MVAIACVSTCAAAGLELIGRLEGDLRVDDSAFDLPRQTRDLRVPTLDLGLVFRQNRFGLGKARHGRLDIRVGDIHQLEGQVDPFLIELHGGLFRSEILDELRHEQSGEHLSLFDLVADIHIPLLDISGQFRIDRRALVSLDEARLADDAHTLPFCGLDQANCGKCSWRRSWAADWACRRNPKLPAATTSQSESQRQATKSVRNLG